MSNKVNANIVNLEIIKSYQPQCCIMYLKKEEITDHNFSSFILLPCVCVRCSLFVWYVMVFSLRYCTYVGYYITMKPKGESVVVWNFTRYSSSDLLKGMTGFPIIRKCLWIIFGKICYLISCY